MIVTEGVVWKICHHEDASAIDVYPVPTQQSFLCSEFMAWREKQEVDHTPDASVDRGAYSTGETSVTGGKI